MILCFRMSKEFETEQNNRMPLRLPWLERNVLTDDVLSLNWLPPPNRPDRKT